MRAITSITTPIPLGKHLPLPRTATVPTLRETKQCDHTPATTRRLTRLTAPRDDPPVATQARASLYSKAKTGSTSENCLVILTVGLTGCMLYTMQAVPPPLPPTAATFSIAGVVCLPLHVHCAQTRERASSHTHITHTHTRAQHLPGNKHARPGPCHSARHPLACACAQSVLVPLVLAVFIAIMLLPLLDVRDTRRLRERAASSRTPAARGAWSCSQASVTGYCPPAPATQLTRSPNRRLVPAVVSPHGQEMPTSYKYKIMGGIV